MPRKYFYRIEHSLEKIGPYRHRERDDQNVVVMIENETKEDVTFSSRCPTPMRDPKGHILNKATNWGTIEGARFGFRSLTQTKKWWTSNPKVYEIFKREGFVLRRFNVQERFDGAKQSVAFVYELKDGKTIPFEKLLTSKEKKAK